MRQRTTAILLFILAFSIAPLMATEIHPNAGTTSATFLKVGSGSRATAMGGAFAAVADDATALYWNPAGLAQLESSEVHFTHDESFEGIRHDFLGYAVPVTNGTVGAAFYGLYTPNDLERRSGFSENDPYEPLSASEGSFQAYDIAAQVSYARPLARHLAGGASIKAIRQTIDTLSAYGAALDLGLLYSAEKCPLTAGLVLQNMGTPVTFIEKSYPLPFNAKLGAAYRWNPRLITSLDLNCPIDNFPSVAAGVEYTPVPLLALRLGYGYRQYGPEITDASGITAGMGVNFVLNGMRLRFDYGFIPQGVLGNSQRVSLTLLFGEARRRNIRVSPDTAAAAPQFTVHRSTAAMQSSAAEEPYRPLQLSFSRRVASGRTALYRVTGTIDRSALLSLEGEIALIAARQTVVELREETGAAPYPRKLWFRSNAPVPLTGVTCTLRVPRTTARLVATTDDGVVLPLTGKTDNGDTADYYMLSMKTLQSFTLTEVPR